MKYLNRTQGINIQMLHEFVGLDNPDCPCALVKTASKDMVADIHTKGFPNAEEWIHAHRIANLFYEKDFDEVFKEHIDYFIRQGAIAKSNTLKRPDHVLELEDYLRRSDAQTFSEETPKNPPLASRANACYRPNTSAVAIAAAAPVTMPTWPRGAPASSTPMTPTEIPSPLTPPDVVMTRDRWNRQDISVPYTSTASSSASGRNPPPVSSAIGQPDVVITRNHWSPTRPEGLTHAESSTMEDPASIRQDAAGSPYDIASRLRRVAARIVDKGFYYQPKSVEMLRAQREKIGILDADVPSEPYFIPWNHSWIEKYHAFFPDTVFYNISQLAEAIIQRSLQIIYIMLDEWEAVKLVTLNVHGAFMAINQIVKRRGLTPNKFLPLYYLIACQDPIEAERNPLHQVMLNTQRGDVVGAEVLHRTWCGTFEASQVYKHMPEIYKANFTGQRIAFDKSKTVTDSVAYNYGTKKNSKKWTYADILAMAKWCGGFGYSSSYNSKRIPAEENTGLMEFVTESGCTVKQYIEEYRSFLATVEAERRLVHNSYARIDRTSVCQYVYDAAYARQQDTAISMGLNDHWGIETSYSREYAPSGRGRSMPSAVGPQFGNPEVFSTAVILRPSDVRPTHYNPETREFCFGDEPGCDYEYSINDPSVSSTRQGAVRRSLRVPEAKVNLDLSFATSLRFVTCGSDFVDGKFKHIPRHEVDIKLFEWRILLEDIAKNVSSFSICLPLETGFFEEDDKEAKYIFDEMRKICVDNGVTWIPLDLAVPYLNTWRTSQYHFTWDRIEEKAPVIIWSMYEVTCNEFMKYMTFPLVIDFCMQTHPFFNYEFVMVTTNDLDNSASIVPPCYLPIEIQHSSAEIPPVLYEVLECVEMLDDCFVFIPINKLNLVVRTNVKDDVTWIALEPLFMDVMPADRARSEIPTTTQLVRCGSFPKGTHMTVGNFACKYEASFEIIFKRFIAMGQKVVEGERTTDFLVARIKVNQQCLPLPVNDRYHAYYLDFVPVDRDTFAELLMMTKPNKNNDNPGLWGGLKTRLFDLGQAIDQVTQLSYEYGRKNENLPNPGLPSKSNLHLSIPSLDRQVKMKWTALSNRPLEGINMFFPQLMEVWRISRHDRLWQRDTNNIMKGDRFSPRRSLRLRLPCYPI